MTKRIAIVKEDKCNPQACGNYLCARLCPVNRTGAECITQGANNKAKIDETLCTGCGICPRRCPFGAIMIINLPESLNKPPVHRYGRNGFHLYSLPFPLANKVIGVVGRNGIGKSTAVKILSGFLRPNLGGKGASYDDLLEFFKGTEAQSFFEHLRDGKIRVSYKPQAVDSLPASVKGKVQELLQRADERDAFDEVVTALDLHHILQNDISTLSGGELQRVTIAAASLKEASVYFFDEPSSYLDAKQRLRMAKFLRSLTSESSSVLVVEHDLIVLDYLADMVHIIYGMEEGYGIVSQPKSAKAGINTYLEGYLKDENVRFRSHAIKFGHAPAMKAATRPELLSWKNISASLGKFTLSAEEGSLFKGEVVGVVGENGIGKTSFVKILAYAITDFKGDISTKVDVAYKSQYLEVSDDTVRGTLQVAIEKYSNELIHPLKLSELLDKKLSELSGGQLQRVAIARTLSLDADLYLLDEPSAYLDVEQRLLVSKIIKNVMETRGTTCLVVDHDLLFLDYLSERLLVFEGQPASHGIVKGPFSMEDGMNNFLEDLETTFRRDPESGRPRANKPGSVLDREQKAKKKYFYN